MDADRYPQFRRLLSGQERAVACIRVVVRARREVGELEPYLGAISTSLVMDWVWAVRKNHGPRTTESEVI